MTSTAVLIAKNWPEPASTAAGRRTLDLLRLLQAGGYHITVASPAEPTPFQQDLASEQMVTQRIAVNDSAFDHWLLDLKPDLVIYDRYVMEEQFGWRVREHCPQAMTLLDTSDFHALREARQTAIQKGTAFNLFGPTLMRELAAMARCDLVLMISRVEIALLRSQCQFPAQALLYLPFLVDKLPDLDALPTFNEREHLMMIGGFKHPPNRDAVLWFKQSIWPLIRRRLPEVECHIYGAYADHQVQQWHAPKDRFLIKGRCEDALTTLEKYRLNLAPLRFGAGQKGKVIDGWLTGTPTVTTPLGAEAMAPLDAWGYTLSDQPERYADAVVALYQSPEQWSDVQQCGVDALQRGFLHQDYSAGLLQALQHTRLNLETHRNGLVWGRILWQTQHRATEFMSRWIEAKNTPLASQ
ncbi:MAG: glycosyltransferase family 4 protein [Saccharospirillum sp.]|nr:glycosyltransferase family 4 protein [Saccharospirillum sp.]